MHHRISMDAEREALTTDGWRRVGELERRKIKATHMSYSAMYTEYKSERSSVFSPGVVFSFPMQELESNQKSLWMKA